MGAATPETLDLEEQIARIRRMREESEKFSAEQHKLIAEALKPERDRAIIPWQVMATMLGAGAALFGAGIAFVKVMGG